MNEMLVRFLIGLPRYLPRLFLVLLVVWGVVSTARIWLRERRFGSGVAGHSLDVTVAVDDETDIWELPLAARIVMAYVGIIIIVGALLLLVLVSATGQVAPG